jgi:hypothetical protein
MEMQFSLLVEPSIYNMLVEGQFTLPLLELFPVDLALSFLRVLLSPELAIILLAEI